MTHPQRGPVRDLAERLDPTLTAARLGIALTAEEAAQLRSGAAVPCNTVVAAVRGCQRAARRARQRTATAEQIAEGAAALEERLGRMAQRLRESEEAWHGPPSCAAEALVRRLLIGGMP